MNSKMPDWFKEWRNGEFYHMKIKVNAIMWLCLGILATLIGTLVARFFFG